MMMKIFQDFWQKINKYYFANSLVALAVLSSVVLMFVVQFKVEALQDDIVQAKQELAVYEDEIQLLEVEWVYLTRPARLRSLSAKYLKKNDYASASQIRDVSELEEYYLVNYQKSQEQELALR